MQMNKRHITHFGCIGSVTTSCCHNISPGTFHPLPFITVDMIVIRDNLVIHSFAILPVCEQFFAALQKISAMG